MIQFKQCKLKKYDPMYSIRSNCSVMPIDSEASFILPESFIPPLKSIMLPHEGTFFWGTPGTYGGLKEKPNYQLHPFVIFPVREGTSWGRLPQWVREIITTSNSVVARDEKGNILFFMEKIL